MKRNISIGTLRASSNCASRMLTLSTMLLTLTVVWLPEKTLGVGYWTALANNPGDTITECITLPDGTVLAEGSNNSWWSLAPDSNGHYANGTWSARNSSSWGHQGGSTAVLQNGNVFISGGENGNGTNKVEIFNTANGSWSVAINPTYFGNIYDGNAMLLSNGKVMIEPQNTFPAYGGLTFLFNPNNNTFSQTTGAPLNGIGEAAWVKLPNDNVLLIDSGNSSAGATTVEYYNPSDDSWHNAYSGGTVPNIWPNVSGTGDVSESGPAFMLPNGKAIFFGGNGVTAIYNNGTWSQGTTLGGGLGQKDAPGAMMFNGKVLLAVSPMGVNSDPNAINGIGPTTFYEYDYTANSGAGSFTSAPSPGSGLSARAQQFVLLDLPDGTVLLSGWGMGGSGQLYVYQPDGSPLAAGRPTINKVQWKSDGTLHLTGTLFNGISSGSAWGDEFQNDSNYPLIRFTGGGNVYYGRTYNWSSTSVQTGSQIVTTEAAVPAGVYDYPGVWSLQIVANGNASPAVTFYSPVWVDFNYVGIQAGYVFWPWETLPPGVSEISSSYPGGTIAIEGNPSTGHEAVPYTISTPMTIISVDGPATIKN